MAKRKVILNLAVSLDGFIEGPNGEFDWCFGDQDYGMKAFMKSIDSIFMGRKSYEVAMKYEGKNPYPHIEALKEVRNIQAGSCSCFTRENKSGGREIHTPTRQHSRIFSVTHSTAVEGTYCRSISCSR